MFLPSTGLARITKIRFFRELAKALALGSPLKEALHGLLQSRDRKLVGAVLLLEKHLTSSPDALARAMEGCGRLFTPFQIHQVRTGEQGGQLVEALRKLANGAEDSFQVSLSYESKLRFFREMSVCLGAGISYSKVFSIFGEDEDPAFAALSRGLERRLDEGQSLSKALGLMKGAFTPFQVSMVSIGEQSGQVAEILKRLAEAEEHRYRLQKKLQNVLVGPCLTALLVAFVLIVLLPLVVFRAYLDLVSGLNLEEVGLFGWLLKFMRFTQTPYWWGGLLGGAALLVLFFKNALLREQFLRSVLRALSGLPKVRPYVRPLYESGRNWEALLIVTEMFVLHMPGLRGSLGRVWLSFLGSRFAYALGLQLEVGVKFLEALDSSIRATGSPLWNHSRRQVKDHFGETGSLESALGLLPEFPLILSHTMRVGEEAGRLPALCRSVTTLLREEFEHFLEISQSLLGPMFLLLLGFVVAGFAVLLLLPMSKVVQAL